MARVCPWWLAYTFDHRGRRLFHKPEKIVGPYVKPGMTVLDVGCGMGYFTIPMASMVGVSGKVIAADLQQRMLDSLMRRAGRAGVADRIRPHLCGPDAIGVTERVDFASAFYMVHETPDARAILAQIRACLKPDARFLLVEPKFEVSTARFAVTLDVAASVGLRLLETPRILLSRAAVLSPEPA